MKLTINQLIQFGLLTAALISALLSNYNLAIYAMTVAIYTKIK